ncbi:MAG: alcohol-forming fatty acyl-CoA reductase, partial [Solirubrobacteraceae bacterium]|nr:alcohol-forming fatty acyl-CoA reductase [Solirubrobacteraceae bacterium]
MTEALPQTIGGRLAGATILLTGATGFVAKAILATALRSLPEVGELRLLLRAADDAAAEVRLREQVLSSSAFADLDPRVTEAALAGGRLRAFACDLTAPHLGLPVSGPLEDVDVAIHCAASVSFQQPLDEMLELNVIGTANLAAALREASPAVRFVHVSTAYAAGVRTGLVLERPSGQSPGEPDLDAQAELDAARSWRQGLEADSRLPDHQERFVRDARQEIGPAGAPAIGARAERARRAWVFTQLVDRGRARARAL